MQRHFVTCQGCGALNPPQQRVCLACGHTDLLPLRRIHSSGEVRSTSAERRSLTVLFCDIVESTALGSELELEDYRELISAYRTLCRSAVKSAGGWVAQFQGDGVVAYFGFPISHEHDAVRAVRAGLGILAALKERRHRLLPGRDIAVDVRIAFHTGMVITGEYSRDDSGLAEGQALNLTRRIQEHAAPNSIVLSAATRALVSAAFKLSGPRTVSVGGRVGEMALYTVEEEVPDSSALRALSARELAPFVGRTAELELLKDRWAQAQQGFGQTVLIIGEAGIGKSRLLLELKGAVAAAAEHWIEAYCNSETANSAFLPITRALKEILSIGPGVDALDSLSAASLQLGRLNLLNDESRSVLASLLDLPAKDDPSLPKFDPPMLRRKTLNFLKEFFLRTAVQSPTILVIEDLHWVDASTLALLEDLADKMGLSPLMVIGTARSHEHPAGLHRLNATQIRLNPLPVPESERLIVSILQDEPQSPENARRIIGITGGNPLFIEQLTISLRHSGSNELDTAGLEADGGAGDRFSQVPTTLIELLQSRLDRLGPDKPIAQIASVIGFRFSVDLLRSISQKSEEEVDVALNNMIDLDLVSPRASALGPLMEFRHVFFQEVAYTTLLKSTRRVLHKSVAEACEQAAGRGEAIRHEIIARHYDLGGVPDKAIANWISAAELAIGRSENSEALSYIEKALTTLGRIEDAEAQRVLEIRLRELMRVPLDATLGWAAERTENNLLRLRQLRRDDPDKAELFSIVHGLCSVHGARGEIAKAFQYCREMSTLVESLEDPSPNVLTQRAFGMCCFLDAQFERAIEYFARVMSLMDSRQESSFEEYYPADPKAVAYCMSAWAYAFLDDRARAMDYMMGALDYSERRRHRFSRAYVAGIASSVCKIYGSAEQSLAHAQEGLTISEENSYAYWAAWCVIMKGHALVFLGEPGEGIPLLRKGIDAYKRTGARQILPYAYGLLAESYLHVGDRTTARALLSTLESERNRNEVKFYDGRLQRLAAQLRPGEA